MQIICIYIYTQRERYINILCINMHIYMYIYIYICMYVCMSDTDDASLHDWGELESQTKKPGVVPQL